MNKTRIILGRYFKIPNQLIIYLVDKCKLTFNNVLLLCKKILFDSGKELEKELDEDDLRLKIINKYSNVEYPIDINNLDIKEFKNNCTKLLSILDISEEEYRFYGLPIYNKPFYLLEDNNKNFYLNFNEIIIANLIKKNPLIYDYIPIEQILNNNFFEMDNSLLRFGLSAKNSDAVCTGKQSFSIPQPQSHIMESAPQILLSADYSNIHGSADNTQSLFLKTNKIDIDLSSNTIQSYIKKIYHLTTTLFGNMTNYHSNNLTYYNEYIVPSLKSIINEIDQNINLKNQNINFTESILKDNVKQEDYFNSIDHHLIITPFIKNIKWKFKNDNLSFFINNIDLKNFWFNLEDNFLFKNFDINEFKTKWAQIIHNLNNSKKTQCQLIYEFEKILIE